MKELTFKEVDFINFSPNIYQGCAKCNPKGDSAPGQVSFVKNYTHYAQTCKCFLNWKKIHRTYRLLKKSNIPKWAWNFHPARDYCGGDYKVLLPDYYTYMLKKEVALKEGRNLWFCGNTGTQKTLMASFLGKYMIYTGKTAHYIPYENLLRHLENIRFRREGEEEVVTESLYRCSFLIIDDIPKNIPVSSSLELLKGFMLERQNHSRSAIYVTRAEMKVMEVADEDFYIILFKGARQVNFLQKVDESKGEENFYA